MRSRRRSACSSMIRKNLPCLCRIEYRGVAEDGGGGALDRRQRCPQLMAHHAKELAAQPFHLLQWRHVLNHGNGGHDLPVFRMYGRRIHERADRATLREMKDDLLGPHGLALAERPLQGKLIDWEVPTVRTPVDHQLPVLFQRNAGTGQDSDHALQLPIGRHDSPRLGVYDQDPHGRCPDQRLQAALLRLRVTQLREASAKSLVLPSETFDFLQRLVLLGHDA